MAPVVFAQDTAFDISAPETLPVAGMGLEVTVALSGNTGFAAVQFTLDYDRAVLRCDRIDLGPLLSSAMSAANPGYEGGAVLAAAAAANILGDGNLAVFHFTALQRGEPSFSLKEAVLLTADGSPVAFSVAINGTLVPVSGGDTDPPPSGEDPGTVPADPPGDSTGDPAVSPFTDISGHWGEKSILAAYELGLVNGMGGGLFLPDSSLTRAQFVMMLWRIAGSPASEAGVRFSDVKPGAWYYMQVAWAYEKGYINGVRDTLFDPNGKITREQAVAILFRYSGGKSGTETLYTSIYDTNFVDSGRISAYAKPAIYWAVYHEIINGTTATSLSPRGNATRAQIAVIFVNFAGYLGLNK